MFAFVGADSYGYVRALAGLAIKPHRGKVQRAVGRDGKIHVRISLRCRCATTHVETRPTLPLVVAAPQTRRLCPIRPGYLRWITGYKQAAVGVRDDDWFAGECIEMIGPLHDMQKVWGRQRCRGAGYGRLTRARGAQQQGSQSTRYARDPVRDGTFPAQLKQSIQSATA
ncbi:MAG: hypothetical protein Cons2KO_19820 [Congregibacter sp.]